MSGTLGIVIAVVGIALFVALLLFVAGGTARRSIAGARNDPATVGATEVVDARMVHGRSEAGHQLNGNGVLAIFPGELRFVLAAPRRTVTTRRTQITNLSVTNNLRLPGKRSAGGPPYLVVEWTSPDGTHQTAFQSHRADALLASLTRSDDTP